MISRLNTLTLLLLIAVGIGSLLWLAPPSALDSMAARVIAATVLYAPLLLFVPAAFSNDRRLLTWLCFLLLFYFCGYTTQLLDAPPARTLAVLKLSLTVVLFVLSVVAIREARPRPE